MQNNSTRGEAPKILVVDDDPAIRQLCQRLLGEHGYDVRSVENAPRALEALGGRESDLVLTDLRMPEYDGCYLLREVKSRWPDIPVIIMTGFGSIESAVEAMRDGATDYISKPLLPDEVLLTLARALEQRRLSAEVRALQGELREKYRFRNLVGASAEMLEVFRLIERMAPTDAAVLIGGETGTGKELAARALHYASERRDARFVKINCSALSETLLESEIFGHEKGAFTGAVASRRGLFEVAHKGTLFLDEIGDMPLSLQVKLLQVIEHGVFRRVGSSTERVVDVRLIAATHKDLEAEIEAGRFRRDLFHRIHVLTMTMPPLRERAGDIPLLVEHFLLRRERAGKARLSVSAAAQEVLARYSWPGNVRELENAIQRAAALCRGSTIRPADLPPELTSSGQPEAAELLTGVPLFATLEEVERVHIQRVLDATDGNKTKAAEILGITRATLRRKLRR